MLRRFNENRWGALDGISVGRFLDDVSSSGIVASSHHRGSTFKVIEVSLVQIF